MSPPQDDFIDGSSIRIIKLAQVGDNEAFTTLVHRYGSELYGYLAGLVGNDEEAEDLVQDTMLRAWQKLSTLQNDSLFKPWLYSIARNMAYDHLRRRQRNKKRALGQSWEDLKTNNEALTTPDSQKHLEEAELLKQALAQLPPKYRDCLLLQTIGGFSQQEVAELLGITKGTVCVYIHKARKQLYETLLYLGAELSQQKKGSRI